MSQAQRIIKYFSICLAALLIVGIFSLIFDGFGMIGNLFTDSNRDVNLDDIILLEDNYKKLEIELALSELVIAEENDFKIESNKKFVNITEKDGILIIEERNRKIDNETNKVILTIPKKYSFLDVSIKTGAGKVSINNVNTNELDLELGAGRVNIVGVNVSKETDIEGGVGEIKIVDCNFNNLDLGIGIGDADIEGVFMGDTNVETGIGNVKIKLLDGVNDYKFSVEKGIGSIYINDEEVNNGVYGNGNKNFFVEGGVGSIKIN